MAGSEATPAGWYRQPDDPDTLRWWDGDDWTDDEMPVPPGFGGPSRRARPAVDRSRVERAPVRPDPEPEEAPAARIPRIRIEDEVPRLSEPDVRPRRPDPGPPERPSRPSAPVRPAQRRAQGERPGTSPVPRTQPGARRPTPARSAPQRSGPAPRPGNPASRHTEVSSRVVARRPQSVPLAVRFGLRALLLAAVAGVGYIGFVQLRDAEPDKAETLPETVTPSPEPDPDAPPISDAVISLGSLPAGWATQAYDPQGDDICSGRNPLSVIPPVEPIQSSSFNRGAAGPFLTSVVTRFEDPDTAKRYLDLVGDTLEACRQRDVEGYTVTLEPLDFPRFGDETFAVALTGQVSNGTIAGTIVYLRVGDRVASIQTLGVNGEDVEMEQVELLSQAVSRRL